MASLPKKEFKNPEDPRGNVKGSIMAIAGPGGVGTQFTVTFSNLPTSGGPFRKFVGLCQRKCSNILKFTTSMLLLSQAMAIVPALWPILTLSFVARQHLATQHTRRPAKSAICPASTARSLPTPLWQPTSIHLPLSWKALAHFLATAPSLSTSPIRLALRAPTLSLSLAKAMHALPAPHQAKPQLSQLLQPPLAVHPRQAISQRLPALQLPLNLRSLRVLLLLFRPLCSLYLAL